MSSANVSAVAAILRARTCFKDRRVLYILCPSGIKFGTGDGHGYLLADCEICDERPSPRHPSVTGVNECRCVLWVQLDGTGLCTQCCWASGQGRLSFVCLSKIMFTHERVKLGTFWQ